MNENELRATVEMCWRVASEFRGPSCGMVFGKNPEGGELINGTRYDVFIALVRNLTAPRQFETQVTQSPDKKEPWQE